MIVYESNQTDLGVSRTWEHQMVHEGRTFFTTRLFAAMGNESRYLTLIPLDNHIHLRNISFSLESGALEIEVLENPVLNANGTSITTSNLNRVSTLDANLHVFHSSNIASYGTTIYNNSLYTDKSGTYQHDEVEEFILNKDRQYLINVSHTGNSANVRISLTWYEPS